jgi:hypothetical protein
MHMFVVLPMRDDFPYLTDTEYQEVMNKAVAYFFDGVFIEEATALVNAVSEAFAEHGIVPEGNVHTEDEDDGTTFDFDMGCCD